MELGQLTLSDIDAHADQAGDVRIIAAVIFAAQAGYGAHTARRFVTALVLTDLLSHRTAWPGVLRVIRDLRLDADIATLEAGRPVTGDIEP